MQNIFEIRKGIFKHVCAKVLKGGHVYPYIRLRTPKLDPYYKSEGQKWDPIRQYKWGPIRWHIPVYGEYII